MCLRICPAESRRPMPKPSTPTLLLIVVRFFTPLRTRARIRFSGMPQSPKPPTIMMAPSDISRTASSALATTLFMRERILNENRDNDSIHFLPFGWPDFLQLMGPLELHCQFPRVEIFADVGQMLLQSRQRGSNIRLIGKSDVTPHGIRTTRNARHLPQCAATGFEEWRICA